MEDVNRFEGEAAASELLRANKILIRVDNGGVELVYEKRCIGRGEDIERAAENAVRTGNDDMLDEIGGTLQLASVVAGDFDWTIRAVLEMARDTDTGDAIRDELLNADSDESASESDEDYSDEEYSDDEDLGNGVINLEARL